MGDPNDRSLASVSVCIVLGGVAVACLGGGLVVPVVCVLAVAVGKHVADSLGKGPRS